ncbi:hypothetical protein MOQ72_42660 [Saccharopolyspora sp. K220]|uniref:hypothetical protein n=1 Tax=Saccharopolyspora soli TaxID=2926618 RepID=UPI001F568BDA|nr:hypothetical protein [Saccharopolyspora soli]MCI2424118.1 hypothetical protein [Saccharopolyspora soli]
MRIRTIKPEFSRSQPVADLPREVRLLWVGLWSYVDDNGVGVDDNGVGVDDNGVGVDDYRRIAADLFALDDDPVEAREFVREGLATLSRASRITRYTVDDRAYLHHRVGGTPEDRPARQTSLSATAGRSLTSGRRRNHW